MSDWWYRTYDIDSLTSCIWNKALYCFSPSSSKIMPTVKWWLLMFDLLKESSRFWSSSNSNDSNSILENIESQNRLSQRQITFWKIYFLSKEFMSISTDEFERFNCCIDWLASLIGDTFGDEMFKISGVLEAKPIVFDDCRQLLMALGEKSNCDLLIGGIGLSGESRSVEWDVKYLI